MDKFTASNGVEIAREGDEDAYQSWSIGNANRVLFAPHEFEALREFFQHERDQELGRWRMSRGALENWVAYPNGDDEVRVMNESNGTSFVYERGDSAGTGTVISNAYFTAHPVSKPWHDAEPGEVWVLKVLDEAEERAYTVRRDRFTGEDIRGELWLAELDCPTFTAGRRIWPEVS